MLTKKQLKILKKVAKEYDFEIVKKEKITDDMEIVTFEDKEVQEYLRTIGAIQPAHLRPTHWCMGWSGELELGYDDRTYLPRDAALILYPQYFDENGKPIKEALPFAKP